MGWRLPLAGFLRCEAPIPFVLQLHRGLQPALDIEQHPSAVRVFAERLEQQLVIDAVEEPFDVEVNDPVGAPAAPSCRPDGVDRRSARSVPVRVRMEPRLQQRLEIPADHFLSDAVGDRGYAQRPRSPIRFRNIHPPNRWRKVAPRGQPIPQLIEIIGQTASNASIDCPSTPAAPWLALTFLKASQTSRFEMSNGFALITRLLPSPVGRLPKQDTAAPSVQPHYRAFNPTTGSSAPVPCIGNLILVGSADLAGSLGIKTTGSHVPCKSLSRSHAAFEPDAAWAGLQGSAQLVPR